MWARVNNNTRTIAVIMPNSQGIRNDPWQKYLATVDQVEALTGYDFYSNVPVSIQNTIDRSSNAASNTAPQTVSGGNYTDLDITAPNTTLGGTATVTGNLRLGGSTLTTGTNKIILGPNATVTRISGFVDGSVEKQFATAGNSFEYPVGTMNGYSPVTVSVTALGQNPSSLTVKSRAERAAERARSNLALKRYWTLTENGDLTANLTFKYLDADVPTGVSEDNSVFRSMKLCSRRCRRRLTRRQIRRRRPLRSASFPTGHCSLRRLRRQLRLLSAGGFRHQWTRFK